MVLFLGIFMSKGVLEKHNVAQDIVKAMEADEICYNNDSVSVYYTFPFTNVVKEIDVLSLFNGGIDEIFNYKQRDDKFVLFPKVCFTCYDSEDILVWDCDIENISKDFKGRYGDIIEGRLINWRGIKTDDEVKKITDSKLSSKAELDFVLDFYNCLEKVPGIVSNMRCAAQDIVNCKRFEVLKDVLKSDMALKDESKKEKAIKDYEFISKLCSDANLGCELVAKLEKHMTKDFLFCDCIPKFVIYFRQWASTLILIRDLFEKYFLKFLGGCNKEEEEEIRKRIEEERKKEEEIRKRVEENKKKAEEEHKKEEEIRRRIEEERKKKEEERKKKEEERRKKEEERRKRVEEEIKKRIEEESKEKEIEAFTDKSYNIEKQNLYDFFKRDLIMPSQELESLSKKEVVLHREVCDIYNEIKKDYENLEELYEKDEGKNKDYNNDILLKVYGYVELISNLEQKNENEIIASSNAHIITDYLDKYNKTRFRVFEDKEYSYIVSMKNDTNSLIDKLSDVYNNLDKLTKEQCKILGDGLLEKCEKAKEYVDCWVRVLKKVKEKLEGLCDKDYSDIDLDNNFFNYKFKDMKNALIHKSFPLENSVARRKEVLDICHEFEGEYQTLSDAFKNDDKLIKELENVRECFEMASIVESESVKVCDGNWHYSDEQHLCGVITKYEQEYNNALDILRREKSSLNAKEFSIVKNIYGITQSLQYIFENNFDSLGFALESFVENLEGNLGHLILPKIEKIKVYFKTFIEIFKRIYSEIYLKFISDYEFTNEFNYSSFIEEYFENFFKRRNESYSEIEGNFLRHIVDRYFLSYAKKYLVAFLNKHFVELNSSEQLVELSSSEQPPSADDLNKNFFDFKLAEPTEALTNLNSEELINGSMLNELYNSKECLNFVNKFDGLEKKQINDRLCGSNGLFVLKLYNIYRHIMRVLCLDNSKHSNYDYYYKIYIENPLDDVNSAPGLKYRFSKLNFNIIKVVGRLLLGCDVTLVLSNLDVIKVAISENNEFNKNHILSLFKNFKESIKQQPYIQINAELFGQIEAEINEFNKNGVLGAIEELEKEIKQCLLSKIREKIRMSCRREADTAMVRKLFRYKDSFESCEFRIFKEIVGELFRDEDSFESCESSIFKEMVRELFRDKDSFESCESSIFKEFVEDTQKYMWDKFYKFFENGTYKNIDKHIGEYADKNIIGKYRIKYNNMLSILKKPLCDVECSDKEQILDLFKETIRVMLKLKALFNDIFKNTYEYTYGKGEKDKPIWIGVVTKFAKYVKGWVLTYARIARELLSKFSFVNDQSMFDKLLEELPPLALSYVSTEDRVMVKYIVESLNNLKFKKFILIVPFFSRNDINKKVEVDGITYNNTRLKICNVPINLDSIFNTDSIDITQELTGLESNRLVTCNGVYDAYTELLSLDNATFIKELNGESAEEFLNLFDQVCVYIKDNILPLEYYSDEKGCFIQKLKDKYRAVVDILRRGPNSTEEKSKLESFCKEICVLEKKLEGVFGGLCVKLGEFISKFEDKCTRFVKKIRFIVDRVVAYILCWRNVLSTLKTAVSFKIYGWLID